MIVAVTTNVYGHVHDANAARYNEHFQQVLGDSFALGDPGFAGVPYCVAGFRGNQLTSVSHKTFDSISRSEQVIIEHVNSFIKQTEVLAKSSKFCHRLDLLVHCVFIVTGWYNFMKQEFDKFE